MARRTAELSSASCPCASPAARSAKSERCDGGGAAGISRRWPAPVGCCRYWRDLVRPMRWGAGGTRAAQAARACRRSSAPRPQRRDHILRLRLAIARRLQLGERREALPAPNHRRCRRGARRVDLVDRDGLLLERVCLILQQRLVLLELIPVQFLRPLGSQQIVRQSAVELGSLDRSRRSWSRPPDSRPPACRPQRRFHGTAFGRQRLLLERRHQLDRAERVAQRLRQCQLRARRQIARALGARGAGAGIGLHDLALPLALPFDIAGLVASVEQALRAPRWHRAPASDTRAPASRAWPLLRDPRRTSAYRSAALPNASRTTAGSLLRIGGDVFELRRRLRRLCRLARMPPRACASTSARVLARSDTRAVRLQHRDGLVPLLAD